MRLSQLFPPIDAYARCLQEAGAVAVANGFSAIGGLCRAFPMMTMGTLLARASGVVSPVPSTLPAAGGTTIGEITKHFDILCLLLEASGAKKELKGDLASLGGILRKFGESQHLVAGLDALRAAMTPLPIDQQIARFVERLKADARTPNFESTYAMLVASGLKAEHMVEIARELYGPLKKGTSRKVALEYIRKSHDAFMSAKRGIDATGGRSAA